jgi:hypothetical protein
MEQATNSIIQTTLWTYLPHMLIITLLVFLQGYLFSLPQLDLGIQSSDRAGDLSGFFLLIPARH